MPPDTPSHGIEHKPTGLIIWSGNDAIKIEPDRDGAVFLTTLRRGGHPANVVPSRLSREAVRDLIRVLAASSHHVGCQTEEGLAACDGTATNTDALRRALNDWVEALEENDRLRRELDDALLEAQDARDRLRVFAEDVARACGDPVRVRELAVAAAEWAQRRPERVGRAQEVVEPVEPQSEQPKTRTARAIEAARGGEAVDADA